MMRLLIVLVLVQHVSACGSSGTNDWEIVTNPAFNMQISPPVGWTYFPTTPSDSGATVWFFVGQSNDTLTAKTRANNEIEASMLEALVDAQIPVQGVSVTNDYTPKEVENPYGRTTGVGSAYGKVEGGAVTQIAAGSSSGGTLTYSAYQSTLTVTIMNIRATRYVLNIVKNDFLQKMSTQYNVKFYGDVTIT